MKKLIALLLATLCVFALTDCIAVHLTDGRGRRVDYCADCGIFNALSAGQRLTLGESGSRDINKRLDQYGSLWDMG